MDFHRAAATSVSQTTPASATATANQMNDINCLRLQSSFAQLFIILRVHCSYVESDIGAACTLIIHKNGPKQKCKLTSFQ